MPGLKEFLLGGIVPMIAALAAFAFAWVASRRASVAWPVGVIVGYLSGTIALEAGTVGVAAALKKLGSPHDAHEWTWMLAFAAAIPAIVAPFLGERRGWRWLLIVPLVAGVPLWLMWRSKYLPSAADRATGFMTQAWSVGEAILILGAVAAAMLLVWRLWEANEPSDQPRTRGFLVAVALSCAAAVAGMSGSFVYAYVIGIVAASVGGCFFAALACRANVGPEYAAGPIVLLSGSLLMLATLISDLKPLHAAGLWIAIALASSRLPGKPASERGRIVLRSVLCLLPLVAVAGHAGCKFAESQRQLQEEAESNPYMNL
ncbi:hypothetical protein [Lacipirellula parvula]|uniref:Uncharacterized protein n=1 Tax=Lacipirellula parvula TaxID=2650471 RepID=A0A5K7X2F6_9BACT|nr:hypothetical protein [Lacipirellula parvula]BBO30660.1 hypothetical protein PLANPX_0272 [Lacipirellula parvula]